MIAEAALEAGAAGPGLGASLLRGGISSSLRERPASAVVEFRPTSSMSAPTTPLNGRRPLTGLSQASTAQHQVPPPRRAPSASPALRRARSLAVDRPHSLGSVPSFRQRAALTLASNVDTAESVLANDGAGAPSSAALLSRYSAETAASASHIPSATSVASGPRPGAAGRHLESLLERSFEGSNPASMTRNQYQAALLSPAPPLEMRNRSLLNISGSSQRWEGSVGPHNSALITSLRLGEDRPAENPAEGELLAEAGPTAVPIVEPGALRGLSATILPAAGGPAAEQLASTGAAAPRKLRAELLLARFPPLISEREMHMLVGRPLSNSMPELPTPLAELNLKSELADPLELTDVRLQFAALWYSPQRAPVDLPRISDLFTSGESGGKASDESMSHARTRFYFSWKLLNFPVVTSPMLCVRQAAPEHPSDCPPDSAVAGVLYRSTGSAPTAPAAPGWQCRFVLDAAAQGQSREEFLRRLSDSVLGLHVFDAQSHILLGVAPLELRLFLRGGQRATQTALALPVLKPPAEGSWSTPNLGLSNAKETVGVLYINMSCVGQLSSAASGSRSGSMLQRSVLLNPGPGAVSRSSTAAAIAKRQADTGRHAPIAPLSSVFNVGVGAGDEERRRKAQRLAILSQRESGLGLLAAGPPGSAVEAQPQVAPADFPLSVENVIPGVRDSQDLFAVQAYRAQHKREAIEALLLEQCTVTRDVSVSYGEKVYLEYSLRNPSTEEMAVVITSSAPGELDVVTDTAEWRALCEAHGCSAAVVEPDLLAHHGAAGPLLVLRPEERVVVPLRCQLARDHPIRSFGLETGPAVYADENASVTAEGLAPPVPLVRHGSYAQAPRKWELRFESLSGQVLGLVQLHVTPLSLRCDQIAHFYEPQHSLFKRRLRMAVTDEDAAWHVVCSDEETYCAVETSSDNVGRILTDVYIKYVGFWGRQKLLKKGWHGLQGAVAQLA